MPDVALASGQVDFDGKSRTDIAIERIRAHCPPEGYWLAFSGGKDSTVIYDLAVRAGVAFDAHYNVTGIDPPELVGHIRHHYPQVQWEMPQESMWKLIERKGLPFRTRRWCCEKLKERGGAGRIVITGIRWEESVRRSRRGMLETCLRDGSKRYLNPIIDWSAEDVWAYIRERHLPYCQLYDEGFKRIGCVLCPLEGAGQTQLEMARWPKIAEAWHRAAVRYFDADKAARNMPTAESFWEWWLSRKAHDKHEGQEVLFE